MTETWFPHKHRTANDGITFEGEATGEGGGSAPIQRVTVPVSSAEILDLVNTPVVLVPGVPNNIILIVGMVIVYLAGATPYTLPSGGTVLLGFSFPYDAGGISAVGVLDQPTDRVFYQPYGGGPNTLSPEQAAQDLTLFMGDTSDNPTLGDGTLLVTVAYFLAPTA